MKKVMMTMMVVVVVLMGISDKALSRSQRSSREDRYGGYGQESHGFRIRIGGCRERYPSDRYRRGRYFSSYGGSRYRYGPVYDRYEYKSEGPYHKYHVHDRRSGGIITGIVEALFGKREMDITEEVKNPYEKQQKNESQENEKVRQLEEKIRKLELQIENQKSQSGVQQPSLKTIPIDSKSLKYVLVDPNDLQKGIKIVPK
ncbi:hypothetical protein KKA24_02240 [Patescibacteria group bacterium]|nr:hypothetical protein [Patescibacteria group bacterium]